VLVFLGYRLQYADCLPDYLGANSIAGQSENVELHSGSVVRRCLGLPLLGDDVVDNAQNFVVTHALLAIRQGREPDVNLLQLVPVQFESEILAPLI
jgi:hypothetical protein